MFTKLRAVAIAFALALALPVSAFAATITAPTSETLTVPATSTITGAPASIAYASTLGGSSVASTPAASIAFTSNSVGGYKVQILSTDLTATTGGTIPNTARTFAVQSATNCPAGGIPAGLVQSTTYADTSSGYHTPKLSGVVDTWCNVTAPGTTTFSNFVAKIAVPAAQAAGAYTGTITFQLLEQ
jgi:hypothetical protein